MIGNVKKKGNVWICNSIASDEAMLMLNEPRSLPKPSRHSRPCIWTTQDYLGGVSTKAVPDGKGGTDTSKIFNWHPVLMTLAFGVFMAEALMAYDAPILPSCSR
eukprot:1159071-Pelagomonas_calceolata.AAC.3